MTKVDALLQLMKNNGGVASWNYIYNNIEKYYPKIKSSDEWQSGLRGVLYREIKNKTNFKKIGLGVFSLIDYEQQAEVEEIKQDDIRIHSYIQGIMIELGNYDGYDTYCPDAAMNFTKNIKLKDIVSMTEVPNFTYETIVNTTKRIDVVWFNKDGYRFPKRVVEVVNSVGTLQSSLNRIYQLKTFQTEFNLLIPDKYQNQINKSLDREPYLGIKNRFVVKTYNEVLKFYNSKLELENLKF